jgi:hypothetical protein
MKIRRYSELVKLSTFEERFRYLKLVGTVGETTFGSSRYLNQAFYASPEWKRARDQVIIRDNGCDLGIEDHEIRRNLLVHHMNPITQQDLEFGRDIVCDPEYLITVSLDTHNAIHYGDESILRRYKLAERKPNDTCPWL